MSTDPILSRPVEVSAIGPGGVERRITATEAERAALATAYGLQEVRSLTADLAAMPKPGGMIAVEGRVTADIVQTCVVSLAPVEQAIDEPVAIRYAPAGADALPPAKPGAEILIDPDAEDPPDLLLGSTIDLGAVAEEHFALAIDPYPRAPDAKIPPEAGEGAAPERDSPFAVLAALRDKPTGSR